LANKLRWPAAGTLLLAAIFILQYSVLVTMGLTLAGWILFSTFFQLFKRLGHAPGGTSLRKRLGSQTLSYWGMIVAHAGIGIFVVGVTLVKGLESSHDFILHPGDSAAAGAYQLTFVQLKKIDGPNYISAEAQFDLSKDGKNAATLYPEKRFYQVQQMPMTIAAIDRGLTRDLYISLGQFNKDGSWDVRFQNKPLVSWIWAGSVIIALGGLLAALDRRYRLRKTR
jgi:cytochrome c-type biogenesis protein CcmF